LEADRSGRRCVKIEIVKQEEAMIQADVRCPDLSVDLPDLLTRLDNDRELLRELFRVIRDEFTCLLQSLQGAVVRGDMKRLEVMAQTIKGMPPNVSFTRAVASAACLERMGKQCVTQGLPEELARLEPEAALALAELEPCCTEIVR
jgi:HPt (histidine-containing phosphotransfer) domain-containing protein